MQFTIRRGVIHHAPKHHKQAERDKSRPYLSIELSPNCKGFGDILICFAQQT